MENATILREKAYIPSSSEYYKAREKFLAFMGARLSDKARKGGASEHKDYKTGWYFSRTAMGALSEIFCISYDSACDWNYSYDYTAGLRVAFNLIYNPQSEVVKSCRIETRKALVYNPDTRERETVESTAPIVKFGNYDCIWLNKEECEAAYEKGEPCAMQLWTLDLVACAETFEHGNDYGKAIKIRKQCESMFTEEQLAEMVEVKMSSEDGYKKATPILQYEDTVKNTPKEAESE